MRGHCNVLVYVHQLVGPDEESFGNGGAGVVAARLADFRNEGKILPAFFHFESDPPSNCDGNETRDWCRYDKCVCTLRIAYPPSSVLKSNPRLDSALIPVAISV